MQRELNQEAAKAESVKRKVDLEPDRKATDKRRKSLPLVSKPDTPDIRTLMTSVGPIYDNRNFRR